jgi:hypothetical protein
MLAETPVRTRGSDEIPESTEHRSWSITGFALEISFWIARGQFDSRFVSSSGSKPLVSQVEMFG